MGDSGSSVQWARRVCRNGYWRHVKKKFPGRTYSNTAALTTWHFDPKEDVDEIYQRRIHHCEAVDPDGRGRLPYVNLPTTQHTHAPAGHATGAVAEGSGLQWYDTVRG